MMEIEMERKMLEAAAAAAEEEVCYSRGILEESGDEELSVLPRHTKVIVTGNNRTKSVLVGLQGVVKKAVGLGGWHWLVLKNGVEVKLQRNALSVLEHPTGNEDDHLDFDSSSSGSEMGEGDHAFSGSIAIRKPIKPRVHQNTKPYTKQWVEPKTATSSNPTVYKDVQSIIRVAQPQVKLRKLGMVSLRRYCRHYNLAKIHPDSSRDQILSAVEKHFASQPSLNERQVVAGLIAAAKKLRRDDSQAH